MTAAAGQMTEPVTVASPWLTVAEVAQQARCCRDTVWDALNSGALHGHRKHPRGPWRVHVDSATAWIETDEDEVAAISSARVCSCRKVRVLRPA